MKKSIISILELVLLFFVFISCETTNNLTIKTSDYIIQYTEECADLIEPITQYLDENKAQVFQFLEMDGLKKTAIIKIFPTLESWKRDFVINNYWYEEWMVGNASNGIIKMLNFHEYSKLNSHKNDSFDDYKKTIFHEFVHLCHQQEDISSSFNRCFMEGLATYLAKQMNGRVNLKNYSENQIYNNQEFTKLNEQYVLAYTVIDKLVATMSHEEFLSYVKNGSKFISDKKKIMEILYSE